MPCGFNVRGGFGVSQEPYPGPTVGKAPRFTPLTGRPFMTRIHRAGQVTGRIIGRMGTGMPTHDEDDGGQA